MEALAADKEFAKVMSDLGVRPVGGSLSPAGFRWHHVKGQPGVMQIVPLNQHSPGSSWWNVLHPGNSGGYAEWGKTW